MPCVWTTGMDRWAEVKVQTTPIHAYTQVYGNGSLAPRMRGDPSVREMLG